MAMSRYTIKARGWQKKGINPKSGKEYENLVISIEREALLEMLKEEKPRYVINLSENSYHDTEDPKSNKWVSFKRNDGGELKETVKQPLPEEIL